MNLLEKKEFYLKNKSKLSKITLEKMEQAFDINFTYHSTTIEGNTLTLMETKAVIEDKISIGGKELREIYEVVNHHNAFQYVKTCIEKEEVLDEAKVKDIHERLTKNIMQGGVYRNTDVEITGATHTPPNPNAMYEQLKFFYEELEKNRKELDAIELAAWTHAEFVRIHPFIDGNGRTARLIMNYQLMKNDFLPINIQVENRLEYYETLDTYATKKDLVPFINLIKNIEEKRLDEVNKIIEQELK